MFGSEHKIGVIIYIYKHNDILLINLNIYIYIYSFQNVPNQVSVFRASTLGKVKWTIGDKECIKKIESYDGPSSNIIDSDLNKLDDLFPPPPSPSPPAAAAALADILFKNYNNFLVYIKQFEEFYLYVKKFVVFLIGYYCTDGSVCVNYSNDQKKFLV